MTNIYNIGIMAHVDAGKTTITENFLYLGGATRQLGSVDKGSAVTDNLAVEKMRGISVRAACTSFGWKDAQINLIDTPGHIDFSAEVERVLRVLDGAILVVSAVEGVQAHTYTLWNALRDLNIPTIIFINKIDRQGADVEGVISEIKRELDSHLFVMQQIKNEGLPEVEILDIWHEQISNSDEIKEVSLEILAEADENFMEKYLEGEQVDNNDILALVSSYSRKSKIFPVFAGVAKIGLGVEALLDATTMFLSAANNSNQNDVSGLVFKIEHDKTLGRLAHIRIFAGIIKNRDTIYNHTLEIEEKVAQIKKIFTNKLEDIKEITTGDIGIVSGLTNTRVGDVLGNPSNIRKQTTLNIPLLTVQVTPKNEADYAKLAEALTELAGEDPLLDFRWHKEDKELHLKIMGVIQMEILTILLENRFGIEAEFKEPTVIYKETPVSTGDGFVNYTMPKPCWAVMRFRIVPGERGSGIVYKSMVGVNDIHRKYQNEVERTVSKALSQGIRGWAVTDIKIELIAGEDHEIHSRPGDFILATPMGLMDALQNTGTKLLEPMLNFEVSADETLLGKIAGDLTTMRAEFANPRFSDGKFTLTGTVPVATSLDYSIKLSSLTGGKGKVRFSFNGYKDCPEGEGKNREYTGVNPLDTSKWILHARGAYKAGEWNL